MPYFLAKCSGSLHLHSRGIPSFYYHTTSHDFLNWRLLSHHLRCGSVNDVWIVLYFHVVYHSCLKYIQVDCGRWIWNIRSWMVPKLLLVLSNIFANDYASLHDQWITVIVQFLTSLCYLLHNDIYAVETDNLKCVSFYTTWGHRHCNEHSCDVTRSKWVPLYATNKTS